MAIETVHAEWLHETTFLLRDRSDFPILMTQPMGVNGSDLLPLSVIGCAAWDVVSILHKQRQRLSSLQVTAESEREEQPPWRFLAIHVHYHLKGTDLDPRLVQKAIALAEDEILLDLCNFAPGAEADQRVQHPQRRGCRNSAGLAQPRLDQAQQRIEHITAVFDGG